MSLPWNYLAGCATAAMLFFVGAASAFSDDKVERPCGKSDLLGTWALEVSKSKGEVPPQAQDLIRPYRIRVYNDDLSFLQVSSTKELTKEQARLFLKVPQRQTFALQDGIVSTLDAAGTVLERYQCRYFFSDFPAGNIKSGTLSLLWLRNTHPPTFILNTYTKIDLSN
jgi:hypothetical protein